MNSALSRQVHRRKNKIARNAVCLIINHIPLIATIAERKDDNVSYWDKDKGIFNPSRNKGRDLPVDLTRSHPYARTFIHRLNEAIGWEFDFPTNDQWEYAARGGNKSRGFKYAGSNNIDEVAWYNDNSRTIPKFLNPIIESKPRPHAVKTKLPNELGIYDMSGNTDELCYLDAGHKEECMMTLRRGGCGGFHNTCEIITVIHHYGIPNPYFGFRLVLNKPANKNTNNQNEL